MNTPSTHALVNSSALHSVPIERAKTIPASWYTDPLYYDLDQKILFEESWQFVGHESQFSSPGSFITATIGNESVIVVKGKDNKIRAFFNVCLHRGGPIEKAQCGQTRMLQCKYHGWTYRLDGTLRGVPRFNRVELFDKNEYNLVPVDLASWEGLLFIRLSPEADSLEEKLDGIRERISPMDLSALRFYKRVEYDIACNWKIYVDNFLEGYHLPFVHPELCDILDINEYVTETSPHYSLQYSPIAEEDNPYNTSGSAFYYHLFPNFMLNILPNRLQTNVILPLGVGKTRVIFDYYYNEVDSEEAIRHIEEDIAFSDKVQWEDIEICEHVQKGVHSRAYDQGRFSVECEQGVYHFQKLLKESYQRLMQANS